MESDNLGPIGAMIFWLSLSIFIAILCSKPVFYGFVLNNRLLTSLLVIAWVGGTAFFTVKITDWIYDWDEERKRKLEDIDTEN